MWSDVTAGGAADCMFDLFKKSTVISESRTHDVKPEVTLIADFLLVFIEQVSETS